MQCSDTVSALYRICGAPLASSPTAGTAELRSWPRSGKLTCSKSCSSGSMLREAACIICQLTNATFSMFVLFGLAWAYLFSPFTRTLCSIVDILVGILYDHDW